MKVSGHKTRSVFDRYDIVDEANLKRAAETQAAYLANIEEVNGYNSVTIGDFSANNAIRRKHNLP